MASGDSPSVSPEYVYRYACRYEHRREFALVSTTTDRKTKVSKRKHESSAANLPLANRLPAASPQPGQLVEHLDTTTPRDRRPAFARRTAVVVWASVVVYRTLTSGFAFNRELLMVYIVTGLMTASIGRHRKMLMVIRDWLPLAAVLVLYDLSQGSAKLVGAPTLWRFQPEADRWLFFGSVPTVWLQEHFKMAAPSCWEVIISAVYMSYFILPYGIAGLLWLHNRDEWKAFVSRFVSLSFAALVVYVLVPAAPPWAAARCTVEDIAGGPANPRCMYRSPVGVPDGGLLGAMHTSQPGAHHFVERISSRGWGTFHLHAARALIDWGQASVNEVAAIPSLHAGVSAMVAMFLWRRIHWRWRPLLAAYPLIMALALVYSAEHYVIDILLGWAFAVIVLSVVGYFESRWSRSVYKPRVMEPVNLASDATTCDVPARSPV
jgi:hypothetical protein